LKDTPPRQATQPELRKKQKADEEHESYY